MHRFLVVAAALVALLVPAAVAHGAAPPPGSTWHEEYIADGNGDKLHADVLRPEGLPADAKTPVIMTVSPYTSHSGATPPIDYDPSAEGPSSRFYDFVNGAHLFERGYTYVIVDLPGFGGSGGCNDWGGPREQAGAARAVEWAAKQKWSTGRVGLYGKSYDGWTGLMAIARQPRGLGAVVAQEPVYSGYRYLYSNGVRRSTVVADPAIFNASDLSPGTLNDTPEYHQNGSPVNNSTAPGCHAGNVIEQQQGSEDIPFWDIRNLIPKAKTRATPLFLTQGFLEDNTTPDGAFELFNNMAGPKRAWFGMWDHVRGNDMDGAGHPAMGRAGWFDEVMRFYDHHVKGTPLVDAPTDRDPPIAVQTSDGTWRKEQSWPPNDGPVLTSRLNPGSYTDDGQNSGTGSGGGNGIWTFSPPLTKTVRVAGEPRLRANVDAPTDQANFVGDVYDVDAAGKAILISRTASLVGSAGHLDLRMYGIDWVLEAGHRIGVLISSANSEWWDANLPTMAPVDVTDGLIEIPFDESKPGPAIDGGSSVKLRSYRQSAPFAVDAETIAIGTRPDFNAPGAAIPAANRPAQGGSQEQAPSEQQGSSGAEQPAPEAAPAATTASAPSTAPSAPRLGRLTVRGGRVRGALVAYGFAPQGAKLTIRLQRGGRTVAVRRVTARYGAYHVRIPVRRKGSYRIVVTTTVGGKALRATTRRRVT